MKTREFTEKYFTIKNSSGESIANLKCMITDNSVVPIFKGFSEYFLELDRGDTINLLNEIEHYVSNLEKMLAALDSEGTISCDKFQLHSGDIEFICVMIYQKIQELKFIPCFVPKNIDYYITKVKQKSNIEMIIEKSNTLLLTDPTRCGSIRYEEN